ncbi:MAG TPA: endonuclease/exonuclease/phosphatase [Thermoguttaceae bacterium]|nr:endonuclease/exonuclease/phosphatase [Thermoguttaceae bacterium]
MWKRFSVLLVFAAAGGMYYFLTHYDVSRQNGNLVIRPRTGTEATLVGVSTSMPVPPVTDPGRTTLRLATFQVGPLDRNKLASPLVAAHLATLLRDFDVVAVQGLHAPNQGLIRDLVRHVNTAGGNYDFAVAPEVGAEPVEAYNAFLFDAGRVEVDRSSVRSVEDPAGRLRHAPLMALFRARGVAAEEAFTFLLVNVELDPKQVDMELDLLDDVYFAVAGSVPAEDDVILLGDFESDDRRFSQLGRVPNMACAVSDTVSTTRGTSLVDNILFNRRATTEFTGRGGVVDLVRRLNLNIEEATMIAEHMPVWIELSVFEGGQAGRIATDAPNHELR